MLEKEKEIRTKLQSQQKTYNETVENLQVMEWLTFLPLLQCSLVLTLG